MINSKRSEFRNGVTNERNHFMEIRCKIKRQPSSLHLVCSVFHTKYTVYTNIYRYIACHDIPRHAMPCRTYTMYNICRIWRCEWKRQTAKKNPCVNLCAIFSTQVCMHRTLYDIKIGALHIYIPLRWNNERARESYKIFYQIQKKHIHKTTTTATTKREEEKRTTHNNFKWNIFVKMQMHKASCIFKRCTQTKSDSWTKQGKSFKYFK